jgi:hypothetical protein
LKFFFITTLNIYVELPFTLFKQLGFLQCKCLSFSTCDSGGLLPCEFTMFKCKCPIYRHMRGIFFYEDSHRYHALSKEEHFHKRPWPCKSLEGVDWVTYLGLPTAQSQTQRLIYKPMFQNKSHCKP